MNRLRTPVDAHVAADDATFLPEGVTWDDLLAEAFTSAVDWLEQRFGSDVGAWTWDDVHRTAPLHPLSARFPDAGLDPPSVAYPGGDDTVQATYYDGLTADGIPIVSASVARYVFDLADWDDSAWIVPLGGSGDPRSPHYADQLGTWAATRLLPMTYSWERIEQRATSREVVAVPADAGRTGADTS